VKWQIEQTLNAIVECGIQTIISYPNSDNGGREIKNTIEDYREKYSFLR
jgi:UDP-N-acetylglucosamine 2-epimerase (non-hydrolysing)/GDP/UDP-N,N'-diacetylbacillosamine 2-epimerase (hydrolysing)